MGLRGLPESSSLEDLEGRSMMARIYKQHYSKINPTTGEQIRRKSRKWYIAYRDHDQIRRTVPGFTDKEATVQLAAQLERTAAHRAVGLVDSFQEHRIAPLKERHIEAYKAALEARGRCPKHIQPTISRIRAIVDGCQFRTVSDVEAHPGRVLEWIAAQRTKKNGILKTTGNKYLAAIKGLFKWMVLDRRIRENPIAHLAPVREDEEPARERRVLSLEAFRKLLDAARNGEPFRSIPGPGREMIYLVAVFTGFRAHEISTLVPGSFSWGENPTVTVLAGYSKRKRRDTLPIKTSVAATLQRWIGDRPRNQPLWPGSWWRKASAMIRVDLKQANIPYQDEAGRVFDFHALRHNFITDLVRAGVNPKVAQTLARHSTIKLTMDRYAHLDRADLEAAVEALPDPADTVVDASDISPAPETDGKKLTVWLTVETGIPGYLVVSRGNERGEKTVTTERCNALLVQDNALSEQEKRRVGGTRIRTGVGGFAIHFPEFVTSCNDKTLQSSSHVAYRLAYRRVQDPTLAQIIAAWDTLPTTLREAIASIVEHTCRGPPSGPNPSAPAGAQNAADPLHAEERED